MEALLFALFLTWAVNTPTLLDVRHVRPRRVTARLPELDKGSIVTVQWANETAPREVVLAGPLNVWGMYPGVVLGTDGVVLPLRPEHVLDVVA